MISAETYTREWIGHFRNQPENRSIDPSILEKMLHSLGLLEKLIEHGLDFIFKGGTSLILLLDDFPRFSTDIDIITRQPREELEKVLTATIKNSVFTSFQVDEKRSYSGPIPKAHYDIFFDSHYQRHASVTLDVLYEDSPYPVLIERKINTKWLKTKEPMLKVQIPDFDSILGDKLTAFAPNTTGIPYFRNETNMSLEIIKQLFDIGILVNNSVNIANAYQSFEANALNQLRYRNLEMNTEMVISDILHTSMIIARRDKNSDEPDKTNFHYLLQGISSFNHFLSSGNFRIEDAIVAAGKASMVAAHFKTREFSHFRVYRATEDFSLISIKNDNFNFLNRLKKTNKEAFYNWHRSLQILKLTE